MKKTLCILALGISLIFLYRDLQTGIIDGNTIFLIGCNIVLVYMLIFCGTAEEKLMKIFKALLKGRNITDSADYAVKYSISNAAFTQTETDTMLHTVKVYGYSGYVPYGKWTEFEDAVTQKRKTVLFNDYKSGSEIRNVEDYLFIVAHHCYQKRKLLSFDIKNQEANYEYEESFKRKEKVIIYVM